MSSSIELSQTDAMTTTGELNLTTDIEASNGENSSDNNLLMREDTKKSYVLSKYDNARLRDLSGGVSGFFNFIKRRPIAVMMLLIAIVAIDLAIFYKDLKTPKIKKVDVYFQPESSDAQVQVQADMSTSSLTTSFAVTRGGCSYFYQKDEIVPFSSAGEIVLNFPADRNDADTVGVTVDFKHTNYDNLRRIYFDVLSKVEANSSVKIDCSITLTATVYGVVPVSVTIPFSHEVQVSELQLTRKKMHDEDKKSMMPKMAVETKSVTTSKVQMDLIMNFPNSRRKKMMQVVPLSPYNNIVHDFCG